MRSMTYWPGGTGMRNSVWSSHGAERLFMLFRQVFPNQCPSCHPASAKSALGPIKAKHRQLNSASANSRALIEGSGTLNQYATTS